MNTEVMTEKGAVRGIVSESGKSIVFRGIPYAAPPEGKRRFRAPAEHEAWEGVRDCTGFGRICPQMDLTKIGFYSREFYDSHPEESEDCLYLNIWTPADACEESGLPVLFWIHGGGYMNGYGHEKEFDGEGFNGRGVILVTINYRLGVFGNFAHPDLEKENEQGISGNYGMQDQICALAWVKRNIAGFGGDPEKITIAGQSAGCMSVQTVVSSPASRGMMRGAILQSGGGLRSFHRTPDKEKAWEISRKLMEKLGASTAEELREVPAPALRDASLEVMGRDMGLGWMPHVDGVFLPDTVDSLAESGAIHDISYMIGSMGDDIGDGNLLQNSAALWCRNQLKLGRKPAYMYFFDRKLPGDDAGAFHSGELWYEFGTQDRCWRPWEPWDRELSDIFSGYIANFVKKGDPNGEGLPDWVPFTKDNEGRLVLADRVQMEDIPRQDS